MKKCPKCLVEIPLRATKCQHCGSKIRLTWKELTKAEKIIGISVVVLITLWIGGAFSDNNSVVSDKSPEIEVSESSSTSFGDEAILKVGNQETVFVAVNETSFDQMLTTMLSEDAYGLYELMSLGLVFEVPAGTKVKVIDTKIGLRKVRILEGKMLGKAGWVSMEFVQKM